MASNAYIPVGWKDSPDKSTPISASNLNKMDNAIKINRSAIINCETSIDDLKNSFMTDTDYTAMWTEIKEDNSNG